MPLPPWRSLLTGALHRNRSLAYARYVQLATVRPDGRPANRTLVFRGFLENTDQIQFVTDDRSQKADQIPLQPWGEICWYFPKTREQFRLLGKLTLVRADDPDATLAKARQVAWQALSDAARRQFTWADPGQPRAEDSAFDRPDPDPLDPLPTFCLLLLEPVQVDHLELRGDPQNRCLYLRKDQVSETDQAWFVQSINP